MKVTCARLGTPHYRLAIESILDSEDHWDAVCDVHDNIVQTAHTHCFSGDEQGRFMEHDSLPQDDAVAAFIRHFNDAPAGMWSAPGRVNLIGEHTDYNDGLVLPFAIDRRTWCALSLRDDRAIRITSTLSDEVVESSLDGLAPDTFSGWSAYVLGVIWALGQSGANLEDKHGVNLALASDVPLGAGLSSSAAIECAVALALNDTWDLQLSRAALAKACQLAENKAVGAPTGIMDQTASLMGKDGHAVLLDCESLESELVPLPLAETGLTVMVIDTHVSHSHATGGYADRRRSCEHAAEQLGVSSLRGVPLSRLPEARDTLDDETFRRVRHIVTENSRVAKTGETLRTEGPLAIGDLLIESHASMRDDFEISVPELDLAVESSLHAGANGARMTGGGFGGAAIALVPTERFDSIADAVAAAFAHADYTAPTVFSVVPADGARREVLPSAASAAETQVTS